jgi:hypothetical protein
MLQLRLKQGENYKLFSLPVTLEVDLNSFIGSKFLVKTIKINNEAAKNFLLSKNVSLPANKSLEDIVSFFEDVLYNYYINGATSSLTLYDQAKQLGYSCENNSVFVRVDSIKSLAIKYVFDSDKTLKSVELPSSIEIEFDYGWAGLVRKQLSLKKINDYLNKKIAQKEYTITDLSVLTAFISKYVKKLRLLFERKMI